MIARPHKFLAPFRQIQQTQAAGVVEIRVASADELFAAIERTPYGDAGNLSCYGRAIVLANSEDIVMPAPVRLWAKHSGLRITSVSRGRIVPGADMDGEALFSFGGNSTGTDGQTEDVQIDGLDIGAVGARAFSAVCYFETQNTRTVIRDNRWTATALITSSGANGRIVDGEVSGNRRVHSDDVTASGGISVVATRSSIAFNQGASSSNLDVTLLNSVRAQVIGNSQLGALVLSGTSAGCSVSLNTFITSVTTTASNGFHTIIGNTNVGALTTLGTDAVGLNT